MTIKEEMKISYIPAAPEWYLVGPKYQGIRVVGVYYEPIIAWEIKTTIFHNDFGSTSTYVSPVSIEGCVRDNMDFAIKRPNGSLVVLDSHELDNEQEAIDFFNEDEERKSHAGRRK